MTESKGLSEPMGDEDPFPLHVVSENTRERLCTALGTAYRAFRRPYPIPLNGQETQVLTIVASCYYNIFPWVHRFNRLSNSEYELMETPPVFHAWGTAFYAAVYCSGGGIPNLGSSIRVVDSYGEHLVTVEDF